MSSYSSSPSVPTSTRSAHATLPELPSIVEVAAPAPLSVAPLPQKAFATTPLYPHKLIIPSIAIEREVVPVGLNAKGEMDVPSGKTLEVGWYSKGIEPGDIGSAVLDAHVFAAFSDLKEVMVGDDIYLEDSTGAQLHFKVKSATTYALADMGLSVRKFLFSKSDGRYLNLITCAGQLTTDRSTYTHRLVVHAELV